MSFFKRLLHSTMSAFRCVCFLAAVYMTFQQIIRYVEDNDASIVTSKLFNENSRDVYPTFTFCFADDPELIYSEAIYELYVTKENYTDLLRGVDSRNNPSAEAFEKIMNVDYNRFAMDSRDHITYVGYRTKDSNSTFYFRRSSDGVQERKTIDLALYNSYQDPDKRCFSRRSRIKSQISSKREQDEFVFDFSTFASTENMRGFIQIYIHYPEQFTRGMDKPLHKIAIKNLENQATDLLLNIGYVSVLRKRSKSQNRCNDTVENDDNEFRLKVIKQVGCVPNYWTSLVTTTSLFGACSTPNQYEKVYGLITNFRSVMSSYDPPCVEMKSPVSVSQQQAKVGTLERRLEGGRLTLIISYTMEDFQEITNVKDFDVETLWSSVGGFIGIFLGYSLLQAPEMLDAVWNTSGDRFILIYWVKYVCATIIPCLLHKRKFTVVRLI